MSKKKKKPVKARRVKAPVEPRWDGAFKKVNRFCTITVVVLIFLLAIFAGLDQELKCYIMETNVATSKKADSIIDDVYNQGGPLLEGVEHIEISAPKGTGNYVALFGEDEVWVVSELTTAESLKVVLLFTILDICTYIITIVIIAKYMGQVKYKKRVALLAGYEIIFLMFAWIVHSYCWGILFNDTMVAPIQTLIRIMGLSVALATFDKIPSIQGENLNSK